MSILAIFSFFVIMLTLASIPSASVALVVARSASLGLRNGVAVSLGIVLGDLIFMAIAVLGMSALATVLGSLFAAFKYIGGTYLIWLGVKLIRSKETGIIQTSDSRSSTLLASFASGFLLTLGDVKAILFYASLFPTLMDLTSLTLPDFVAIVLVTIVTVGGVKLVYAVAARSIVSRLPTGSGTGSTKKIAGGVMIGTGTFLLLKS